MMKPTVHLNGSARSALAEQYRNAYIAVNDALTFVAQSAPNGRDYYPQGSEAFGLAAAEHTARLQRLTDVQNELLALYESLDQ